LFLSDGGLETTLIVLEGVELPHFAALVLLCEHAGRGHLRAHYRPYLALAAMTAIVLLVILKP
jgi:homocysteine S-methyltransferase